MQWAVKEGREGGLCLDIGDGLGELEHGGDEEVRGVDAFKGGGQTQGGKPYLFIVFFVFFSSVVYAPLSSAVLVRGVLIFREKLAKEDLLGIVIFSNLSCTSNEGIVASGLENSSEHGRLERRIGAALRGLGFGRGLERRNVLISSGFCSDPHSRNRRPH